MVMPMTVSMVMSMVMVVMVMIVIVMVVMPMTVRMIMAVRMIMRLMLLRFRFTGSTYFHWIVSIPASTGVTHSYSFCSTSKDFICSSVPRISLTPIRWHSGQWLKTPSGL